VSNRTARRQRGFQALAGRLTATEGPLRAALSELARRGIGERIVKSALAATLAWLIADQIPREAAPFVAALTAVYTMDLTILKSLRSAWQRIAGITLGIGVAFLAAEFVGVHSWSVGLVILASLVIGLRLNLEPDGMTQVAGTAIVVMVVRSTTEERSLYALTFLADTAIGTAVGLTVNSIFAPPNFVPAARRALAALTDRLTDLMDQLATMVVDGITPGEAQALSAAIGRLRLDLHAADESLSNAEESLRFNPLAHRQRSHLTAFHGTDHRLEQVVNQVQRLVDALGSAHDAPWMGNLSLTEALANVVSAATLTLGDMESGQSTELHADLTAAVDDLGKLANGLHSDLPGESWTSLGQIVESARALAAAITTPQPTPVHRIAL
jgi:uncharacterized membrane protein YgaE (UPF0421/DUF939 family)